MEKTKLSAIITQDGKWFVAECTELGIAPQAKNITDAVQSLKEACELYLEEISENPDEIYSVSFSKLKELPPSE